MDIEKELIRYITEEILADPAAAAVVSDEPLISTGRVDSMGLLQILSFVQEKFGVDLLSVAGPADLETVSAMASAIRRRSPEHCSTT